MEAAQVIAVIQAAFDGVPRPERISLRVARAADDYVPEAEWAAIRTLDTDTRWQDVPDRDLEEYWDVHPFLDGTAFRYYIPAFMVWCIRHNGSTDLATAQWTLSALKEPPDRLAFLTRAERNAVAQFLKFAAADWDEFDAPRAAELYRKYWRQYDESPNHAVNRTPTAGAP